MYSALYTYITQGWAIRLFWMLTETCSFSVLSINYQLDRQVILHWSFFSKYSKAMRFLLSHRLPRAFIITLLDTVYSIPRTVQWSRCTRYRHTVWFIPSKEKYSVKVIRRIFYCLVIYSVLKPQKTHQWFWYDYIKGYELNVQHTFYFNLSSQAKGQETKALQLWQLVDPFE